MFALTDRTREYEPVSSVAEILEEWNGGMGNKNIDIDNQTDESEREEKSVQNYPENTITAESF